MPNIPTFIQDNIDLAHESDMRQLRKEQLQAEDFDGEELENHSRNHIDLDEDDLLAGEIQRQYWEALDYYESLEDGEDNV